MHIHLYISGPGSFANRLKAVLWNSLSAFPVIQYYSIEAIGRVMPTVYDEKAVALVMVTEKKELEELAEKNYFWDRVKTILILPDSDPETISLGHALKPSFVTFIENDFSDALAVLNHICESANGDIYN